MLRSRCGHGTVAVWSRFGRGTVAVRSWYGRGTVMVRSRHSLGTLPIRSMYGTLKICSRLLFSPRRASNLVHALYDLLFAVRPRCGQVLSGTRRDVERTVHGPFRFTYAYYAVLQLNFMRVQRMYLSWISNSASRLLVCNQEVERDPVLKP